MRPKRLSKISPRASTAFIIPANASNEYPRRGLYLPGVGDLACKQKLVKSRLAKMKHYSLSNYFDCHLIILHKTPCIYHLYFANCSGLSPIKNIEEHLIKANMICLS